MEPQEQIDYLLSHPQELIKKKPFTRGSDRRTAPYAFNVENRRQVGEVVDAALPQFERNEISQDRFLAELDPHCHDVLFDQNIPSISVKLNDGSFVELEFKKMAVPFQKMIRNKHVLHLCGYDIQHTLDNVEPTDEQRNDFATFKRYWKKRNMGGLRTKLVSAQKSVGDGGLLFYFDRNGEVKARLLSYEDGYVLCSHNDKNGDRLVESVYYRIGDTEYIDSYTDKAQYRHVRKPTAKNNGWEIDPKINGIAHGFNEIPLVTKRGKVAWDAVESEIEVYEIIYNIFLVIQKRHGWGILYIKGTFNENAKKMAGAIVLNDSSLNKDGDAKYLTAPSPEGMLDTLKLMEETIQKGSGTTFILPKDISTAGDISGVAIEITQSLDNEEALSGVIEWQNVASKMSRLFKYGLSKELVNSGDKTAITRFDSLEISSCFKQWRPRNNAEYNQMLSTMKSSGILSQKTAIEKNTESTPDEEIRIAAELPAVDEEGARSLESGNAPTNTPSFS